MAETCRVIKVHRILLKSNTFTSTVTEGRVRGKNIEKFVNNKHILQSVYNKKEDGRCLKMFFNQS